MRSKKKATAVAVPMEKMPTGITGFDEITHGGLPKGRPTLVCGAAGAGKTLFAAEFIVAGITKFNEPGVIVSFEETPGDLEINMSSLGFDLGKLQRTKRLMIEHIEIERSEIEETGEYDLSGLFIRLGLAIDKIGARRIMLDTIENLFAGLDNQAILRAELRRLFSWLKDKGITAVITAEKGNGQLTRQGLEEYVSDCVILLDHRVDHQVSTRRMRIIKYRGSLHGTNEYPFLIDTDGISVLPVTSLRLDSKVNASRISSGLPSLDEMLGGKGFYRGTAILISGTAGTGKTSVAATFADAACKRKERTLFFSFEESPDQLIRNMRSIGMDLQAHVDSGMLRFSAARPTLYGMEMHLVTIHKQVKTFRPQVVILDPISNLMTAASISEIRSALMRVIDFLRSENITILLTSLNQNTPSNSQTDESISSLVDAWISIRDIEGNGERNRALYIMKSRGMRHSNQVREFVIESKGIHLVDVFLGPDGILTGSAREAQQLMDATGTELRKYALGRKDREIDRKRRALEAQITALREEFDSVQEELNRTYQEEDLRKEIMEKSRKQLSKKRS
ncbi:MAG TPA: circadian clock protein KaiC [Puia sp.]|nr:circadian clock protein KaiC [Puia sp.]